MDLENFPPGSRLFLDDLFWSISVINLLISVSKDLSYMGLVSVYARYWELQSSFTDKFVIK
jgi:hypothetical protein